MIYSFEKGKTNSMDGITAETVGGKALGLITMCQKGLPIPAGFVIGTSVCVDYMVTSEVPESIGDAVHDEIHNLKDGADGVMPLLSVRSGARVSMAGMMDTILNVGLTDGNLSYWKSQLGERAALDCYRRLFQMYGSVVLGIDPDKYEKLLAKVKGYKYGLKHKPTCDAELTAKHLNTLIDSYKTFTDLPQSLEIQIGSCIRAVFDSWNNDRAKLYRKLNGFSDDWGTAVVVQSMVFGNLNDNSCSGVLFTRNPSTGEQSMVGEYLPNAQGEDVVAGVRTPLPFSSMSDWNSSVTEELTEAALALESKDMQDIEFTVQNGELFILQTRVAKRSGKAAFRVAHDYHHEGRISDTEALSRVTVAQYYESVRPCIEKAPKPTTIGLPASAGVVQGVVVFTNEDALACTEPCILVRRETTPNDLVGIGASVGILTATGGTTSHAAVVARGMGKVCVVGCKELLISLGGTNLAGVGVKQGDTLTLCGETGRVWLNSTVVLSSGTETPEVTFLKELALKSSGGRSVKLCYTGEGLGLLPDLKYNVDLIGIRHLSKPDWKKAVLRLFEEVKNTTSPVFVTIPHECPDTHYYETLFGKVPDDISDQQGAVPTLIDSMWSDGIVPSNVVFIDKAGLLKLAPKVRNTGTIHDLLQGGTCLVSDSLAASIGGDTVLADLIDRLNKADTDIEVLDEGATCTSLIASHFGK